MDPCSNQSSRRVGSLSHGHLDRGGWMTTAGLFFNKMSRRSRSFAPGRANRDFGALTSQGMG